MEEEYKTYRLEKKSNPVLRNIVVAMGICIIMLYTSNIWYPTKSDYKVTPYDTAIVNTDLKRELTLIRWEYSETQKLMQVQMQIKNSALDGVKEYVWSAKDRYKGIYEVEAVYQDYDIIVVNLINVPKDWTVISLRMGMPENDPNYHSILKILGNYSNIQKVDNIENLDKNGYYKLDAEHSIAVSEKIVLKLEKDKENLRGKIEEINRERNDQIEKMEYLTEKEKEKAKVEIGTLENTIVTYQNQISELEAEQEEQREKIEKQREKIESLEENKEDAKSK